MPVEAASLQDEENIQVDIDDWIQGYRGSNIQKVNRCNGKHGSKDNAPAFDLPNDGNRLSSLHKLSFLDNIQTIGLIFSTDGHG